MKLFNKCKVCGENVGLFNTELENPNDWAYDDYEKDKARDYIIHYRQKLHRQIWYAIRDLCDTQ